MAQYVNSVEVGNCIKMFRNVKSSCPFMYSIYNGHYIQHKRHLIKDINKKHKLSYEIYKGHKTSF